MLPYASPCWWAADDRRWLGGLIVAMGVMVGMAFVLEHGFGVIPCPMCWWQRYAHMVLGVLAVVGVMLPKMWVRWGLLPLLGTIALAGLGVALWQFAAQHGLLPWPPSCGSAGAQALVDDADDLLAAMQATKVVPCDKETFKLWGLSLAGWNIGVMGGVVGWLAYIARRN